MTRAIASLIDAGLVERIDTRAPNGRFESLVYRVDFERAGLARLAPNVDQPDTPPTARPTRSERSARPTTRTTPSSQLDLFDPANAS